jgi:hypothetical protein
MEYLRTDSMRFDICIASGVLYHMRSPVELIHLLARRSDRLFLWTHYYDPAPISRNGPVAERFRGECAVQWNGFCGGSESHSYWMSREEILACLRWLGFEDVRIAFEEPEFAHGPCFALAALRHRSG